jgi:hypothetical protein
MTCKEFLEHARCLFYNPLLALQGSPGSVVCNVRNHSMRGTVGPAYENYLPGTVVSSTREMA